jgi:hypothetical protein
MRLARAQAEATKAAQRAGIEHAKQTDKCVFDKGTSGTPALSAFWRCANSSDKTRCLHRSPRMLGLAGKRARDQAHGVMVLKQIFQS